MSSRFNPAENRYTPRDRSPARYDRRGSGAYNNSSRPNEPDQRPRDPVNPSTTSRDVPRGPKALVDAPRGAAPPSNAPVPSGPRGRGFGGRPELRDAPPLSDTRDRDRTWRDRDREFDRRDRRPSPRGRSPLRDPRDNRDYGPRDIDVNRAQRGNRDGPPSAGSNYSDPPPSGTYGRGGFGRLRGRGDWEHRGRGRGHFPDDRDMYRARSRSRGSWRDKDPPRDDRDHDRRFDRRDDDRRIYRDREDRETDRYKPAARMDSRSDSRPAPADSASPHVNPAASAMNNSDRFTAPEPAGYRDFSTSRRSSLAEISNSKEPRRDAEKSDLPPGRSDLPPGRFPTRTSSPVQAPSVPAFGSVPAPAPRPQYNGPTSNVWRAPEKPATGSFGPNQPTATKTVPISAPTAPKALSAVPPSGPKASRPEYREARELGDEIKKEAPPVSHTSPRIPPAQIVQPVEPKDVPSRSIMSTSPPASSAFNPRVPPIGPQANNRPNAPLQTPTRPSADMTISSHIPSGPRHGMPPSTSPKALNSFIPTGPKAERLGAPGSRAPMHGSPPFPARNSLQWVRQPPPAPPVLNRPQNVVPAKRDASGEERERSQPPPQSLKIETSPSQPKPQQSSSEIKEAPTVDQSSNPVPIADSTTAGADAPDNHANDDHSMMDASPLAEKAPLSAKSSAPGGGDDLSEDEEGLGLDEADFAEAERKFEREKKRLESKRQDLSDRSLRALTPLEEIMRLSAITMDEINFVRSLLAKDEEESVKTVKPAENAQPEIPTPREEEVEDVSMHDADSKYDREPSTEREETPDISSLPFLFKGLPTPLSDPDHENHEKEGPSDEVVSNVKAALLSRFATSRKDAESKHKRFWDLHARWREDLDVYDEIDPDEEDPRQKSVEPKPATTPDPTTIAPPLPTPDMRRSHKYISEYQMELILKESAKAEEERQAKEEREAKKSKPDLEKEAVIPDLFDEKEKQRRRYFDTTRLRQAEQALRCYHFDPPVDDFTPDEHRTLVANYHQNPKKWGLLASSLPGRDYKQCINHYYTTKWDKEYKQKVGKRKGKGSKAARVGAARGRAPINTEAINRHDNGDDGSSTPVAVNEKGRPRRAAAPTFGVDTEGETIIPTVHTPRGRGEATSERGTKRRALKEKVPRKPRTQMLAPAATSPAKPRDRPEKPPGVKQEEFVPGASMDEFRPLDPVPQQLYPIPDPNLQQYDDSIPMDPSNSPGLTTMNPSNSPGLTTMNPSNSPGLTTMNPSNSPGLTTMNPTRPPTSGPPRTGPSSYWSVQEQTDFRRNIAYFGTNFGAIANHMGTKTATMVNDISFTSRPERFERPSRIEQRWYNHYPEHFENRLPPIIQDSQSNVQQVKNQYLRLVESGNNAELADSAQEADRKVKSGVDLGPPPIPTTVAPRRRYDTTTQSSAPRTLAPNPDVEMSHLSSTPTLAPAHSPPQMAQPPDRYPNTNPPVAARTKPIPPPHASPPMLPVSSETSQQSPPHHHPYQPLPNRAPPRAGVFDSPQSRPIVQPGPVQPIQASPHQAAQPQQPSHIHQRPEQQRPSHSSMGAGSPPYPRASLQPQEMEMGSKLQLPPQSQPPQQKPAFQDRNSYSSMGPRHGPGVAPPPPTHLPRSTGPPSGAELQSRNVPAQPTSISMHRPQTSLGRAIGSPIQAPLSVPPPSMSERSQPSFPREEPRPSSIPAPLTQPVNPPPPKAAPKASNLMSLLNPEPAAEEPKPVKREIEHSMSAQRPPPPSLGQNPPVQMQSSRQTPYNDPTPPSYNRQSYAPPTQVLSRPPSRPISDPPPREMGHAPPRDSWPSQRAFNSTQASLSRTSSPLSAHPPASSLSEPRQHLFGPGHRSMAFSQHNQTRGNPSPPPSHPQYSHSRTPSYSQSSQQPPSQIPGRTDTPPVGASSGLHRNPYAQVNPPGGPPLGQSTHLSSQAHLSDRSHSQNQNVPYSVRLSEPPPQRGINITDRIPLSHEDRAREHHIQKVREQDLLRQEQEKLAQERREMREQEIRNQEMRERDLGMTRHRERDRESQAMLQQRYSQHTPQPTHPQQHEPYSRYAPQPPGPPTSRGPVYPLSGGESRGPPPPQLRSDLYSSAPPPPSLHGREPISRPQTQVPFEPSRGESDWERDHRMGDETVASYERFGYRDQERDRERLGYRDPDRDRERYKGHDELRMPPQQQSAQQQAQQHHLQQQQGLHGRGGGHGHGGYSR